MKTLKLIVLATLFIFGYQSLDAKDVKQEKSKNKNIVEVVFNVSMDCHSCKSKIEKNIPWEKGVKDLTVDLEKKTVTIKYDKRKTDEEKLKEAITKLDFTCDVESNK